MANKKISALTAITSLDTGDLFAVVDVTTPETKKITAANLWLGGFNAHKDTDGTFAANSDLVFPTQKAAKTYADTAAAAKISDTAFGAGWNAVTTIAPSKNAVYDAFQLYLPLAGGTMSGNIYMANLGSIGESGGTRLSFDYTNNAVVLNGGTLGIGNSSALSGIYVQHNISGGAGIYIARSVSDIDADTIGLTVSVTESATAASTKQKIGIWNTVTINNDNYARSGSVLGLYSSIVNYSTNTTAQQIAGSIRAVLSGTGTVTVNQGVLVAYGIIGGGAATITGNYGIYLASQKDAGTITTDYGLYIGGGFATTANYGIRIADQTTAASNYAIYTGAGMVRFGGEFGCNGATPRAKATVNAACSDLATAVALLNQIRTALINNGICQ
jgi:hypothetical protein